MKTIISAHNLCKSFGKQQVFKDLNFEIMAGDMVAIVGPSGIGKSTLLNIIGELDTPSSGHVKYDSCLFEGIHIPFPFVFQEHESLLPWLTVEENLQLIQKDLSKDALHDVLEAVELTAHRNKYPSALSGGMKQRVGIARALLCHSKCLLMDEPFGSLDETLKIKLQQLVMSIKAAKNLTVIMVTHDKNDVELMANRIIDLNKA